MKSEIEKNKNKLLI